MAPLWKSLLHPHLLLLTEAFPHPHVKKKKKKRQYNVLSETSKSTIFATLAEVLILQLFVGDVLEILLIFFSLESLMCTFMPPFIIGLASFPALPC